MRLLHAICALAEDQSSPMMAALLRALKRKKCTGRIPNHHAKDGGNCLRFAIW
jgi:hypothetical protein